MGSQGTGSPTNGRGPGEGLVPAWGIGLLTLYMVVVTFGVTFRLRDSFPRCAAPLAAQPLAGTTQSVSRAVDGAKPDAAEAGPESLTLLTIEPNKLLTQGGPIIIAGSGFQKGMQVYLDGQSAGNVDVDGTRFLRATAPAHGPGAVTVTVRTDNLMATLPGGVTYNCPPIPDGQLMLLVLYAGALGALLHGLRSMFWYVGNRQLVQSWVLMYVLLPLTGSGLAFTFFLIARAGFYDPTQNTSTVLVGLAVLVGMFSNQASAKLKDIAEGLFTKADQGANHVEPAKPAPATPVAPMSAATIAPNSGTANGGDTVFIGNLPATTGASVTIGGTAATSTPEDATTLKVVTPAHAAGTADVVVSVPGQPAVVIKSGFTFN